MSEQELETHLEPSGVILKPYSSFLAHASTIVLEDHPRDRIMLEEGTCTLAMYNALPSDRVETVNVNPVEKLKALKNSSEIDGMRDASVKDSTAIVKYFSWLSQKLEAGATINEFEAAKYLSELRLQQKGCVGDSFPTISSSGANAAIIHYHASEEECAAIKRDAVYLCDTGGQYLTGTTDITRTLHFGKTPTEEVPHRHA